MSTQRFGNRRFGSSRQPGRMIGLIGVLLVILGFVYYGAVLADDTPPTSDSPPSQASPLEQFSPTNEELLSAPPSIERYVAAHTVTSDTLSAAGIVSTTEDVFQFLPFTLFGISPVPGQVILTAGQPNSTNTWELSWTESQGATGYEIQEAKNEEFADAVSTLVDSQTSMSVQKTPSPSNVYFYRVRSLVGLQQGPWSNVGRVVGGYYDNFENPASGWSLRRTTYIEEVHAYYDDGEYVLDVNDRWDWGIASPGMPAPRVPYVINFDATIVDGANLWSFGAVFGGDWPAENCPAGNDFDGWYLHGNCFNHFYNTNNIFYGPIKLLFERVDRLEWCLKCGGSPMKRIGDIDPNRIKTYKLIDPTGWNNYRIEVRADSIKIYAAKRGFEPNVLQYQYTDTRYVNSPYFGLFASTDEYTNALWRFDYFQVLPLDE